MNVLDLKKYIFENNKIEEILQKLGCSSIQFNKTHNYYSSTQPDGDNPQGVNIYNNNSLRYRSFTRNVNYDDNKDIFDFIQYIKKIGFVESVKFIHHLLDIPCQNIFQNKHKTKTKRDMALSMFKEVQSKRYCFKDIQNDIENHINKMKNPYDFQQILHIDWFREGITNITAQKFGIGYSYQQKRIIIPMKYWLTGDVIGYTSRTTIDNFELLGIKKYFITPTYPKQFNLYGLYEHYRDIQKEKMVIVYESEKSVLKRDSLFDFRGVALSGKSVSDEQAKILMGLNVEIVFAFDKDVKESYVIDVCERFSKYRSVSYIYDKYNLLKDKDSPADAKKEIFNYLLNHRCKVLID